MRKQDFVPPIFGDGPKVDAPEFAEWLAKQGEVKLPFTVWREPKRTGVIGVHKTPTGKIWRFNDGALGIPLDERLRLLCKDAEPCHVWLSGRVGAMFGMPDSKPDEMFSVMAVHEVVKAESSHYAQSVRGPDCLMIAAMRPIHCARGSKRCEKCKAAESQPALPKLLDVCPYGDHARPTISFEKDGKTEHRVFDVMQSFASVDEAKAFAEKHKITNVRLSE